MSGGPREEAAKVEGQSAHEHVDVERGRYLCAGRLVDTPFGKRCNGWVAPAPASPEPPASARASEAAAWKLAMEWAADMALSHAMPWQPGSAAEQAFIALAKALEAESGEDRMDSVRAALEPERGADR